MTLPFKNYAFDATGETQSPNTQTLPDRLSYIKNVKDFGAKGDNATDNLAAINAAITAAINATSASNKGTVYFPLGTYLVSGPIIWNLGLANAICFVGEPGATIIGNFADFIFKYGGSASFNTFDMLIITNNNATGGGISFATDSNNQAIRNCIITANQGIFSPTGGGGPLDGSVENCIFKAPSGGQTNSYGAGISWNGQIRNCLFIGIDYGLLVYGQEGTMDIIGCRFEQCKNGFAPGTLPPSFTADSAANFLMSGCYFKNCSTSINMTVGSTSFCNISGVYIEGNDGQFRGGNCQYGIQSAGPPTNALVAGAVITGNYDKAAVALTNASDFAANFVGVSAANGSATGGAQVWSWPSPMVPYLPILTGCNTSNAVTAGGVLGLATALEGDSYDVTDGTNGLAWGATLTNTGTHTTHYRVRNNSPTVGSPNFTVVGQ